MGGWSKGACKAPAARQPRRLAPAPTAAAAAAAWPLPLPQRGCARRCCRCYWGGCAGPPPSRQAASTRPGASSQAATRLPWPCLPMAAACPHADVRCTNSAATLAAAAGVGARSSSAPAGGQAGSQRGGGKGREGRLSFGAWSSSQCSIACLASSFQWPIKSISQLHYRRAEQSGASSSTCSTSTSNSMHQHATATAQHARRTQLCCRLAALPLHQCGDSAELEARVATQGVGRRLPGCSSRQSAADSCSSAQRIAAPDRQERGCRRGADAGPCRQHPRHCRQHPHEFC
jgi:hypothetical protein